MPKSMPMRPATIKQKHNSFHFDNIFQQTFLKNFGFS